MAKKKVRHLEFAAREWEEGMVLECLRYAGVFGLEKDWHGELTGVRIYPPRGVDTEIWAKMNSERIASFGKTATIKREG